jgi:tetratricopeptide (TPR) repeat protein
MHILRFILLVPTVILFFTSAWAEPDTKRPDLITEIKPSLVTIVSYDAKGQKVESGSGFIIREDGLIATTWRLVAGASKVKVFRYNHASWTAQGLVTHSAIQDLAIIKVAGKGLPAVKVGELQSGTQKATILGIVGTEVSTCDATLTLRTPPSAPRLLRILVPIPGNCIGGPIVNSDGRIIGMAASIRVGNADIAFGIPVEDILKSIPQEMNITPFSQASTSNSDIAESLFLRGLLTFQEGDAKNPEVKKKIENALTFFLQALEKKKDFAEARFYAGYCFAQLGRNEEAIASYKEAIKVKPNYADAYFGLGLVYIAMDLAQDAIASFEEVVRVNPNHADAWYNLALLYIQQGWASEAIECFENVVRLNPNYTEAYYNMGVCYVELRKHEEAIQNFKQALNIKPDSVEAHFGLGVAYLNIGNAQEALEAFKQTIRLKPDYADAHFYLGTAYLKLEKIQEALDSFKQTVRLNPQDADAYYQMGMVYKTLTKTSEAIESLKQAVKVRPNFAEAHYSLGLLYLESGDRGAALDEYKMLKDLDPNMAEKLFKAIYP